MAPKIFVCYAREDARALEDADFVFIALSSRFSRKPVRLDECACPDELAKFQ